MIRAHISGAFLKLIADGIMQASMLFESLGYLSFFSQVSFPKLFILNLPINYEKQCLDSVGALLS